MPANQPIPLYLFAKAPEPGRVKTRMQPALNAVGCARLAEQMLMQSAAKVADSWPGQRVLCVAPELDHAAFDQVCEQYGFTRQLQIDANLGDRMLAALSDGLRQSGQAVVMGCDVPYLDGAILAEAWSLMQQGRNVIGPAEDGGFYLLGVEKLPIHSFDGVAWGGDRVMRDVVFRAGDDGLEYVELPTLRDIDRIDDLMWLGDHFPEYRSFLPSAVRSRVSHG